MTSSIKNNHTLKKDSFCIYSHDFKSHTQKIGFLLENNIYSYYPIEKFEDMFIFYVGVIYNLNNIKKTFNIIDENVEKIIAILYKKIGYEISNILDGAYSIVIVQDSNITMFRDRNGLENLYYYKNKKNNSLIISNSIKEIIRFFKPEINVEVLPKYLVFGQINDEQTFLKDVYNVKIFEKLKYNYNENIWSSTLYNDVAYQPFIDKKLKEKIIISKLEEILTNRLKFIIDVFSQCKIINTLSGGVDSSLTQYILKKLGHNRSFCANYLKYGQDGAYSLDVANLLESDHTIIDVDQDTYFKSIEKGIIDCEMPNLFRGEIMLTYMYKKISESESNSNNPIICFDGQGAESTLGFSSGLKAMKYLRKTHSIFRIFNELAIRFISKEKYSRNNEFIKAIRTKKMTPKFISAILNENNRIEIVKKAFNISDLSFLHNYELNELNKYDCPLIEKIYRLHLFETETKRVCNIRYQIAKKNDIVLVFPFIDRKLIKLYMMIPSKRKVKFFTNKIQERKLLNRYLPRKLIYRKKVGKGVPFQKLFKHDKNFTTIIEEIRNVNYGYFNFDINQIFYKEEDETIAMRLINFHIWHKLFIEDTYKSKVL